MLPREMEEPACQGRREILERAARLQVEHGTAYDMPYGTDAFRKTVIEKYWSNSGLGYGREM
jgi:hypothetical protein